MNSDRSAVEMVLERDTPESRRGEGITVGVPFERGAILPEVATSQLWLVDKAGTRSAVQGRVLERWADGSVRWLLIHALIDSKGEASDRLLLSVGEKHPARPSLATPLGIDGVEIDTGTVVFQCRPGAGFPLSVASTGIERMAIEALSATGDSSAASFETVELVENGPCYCQVRSLGSIQIGRRHLRLETVFGFFSGHSRLDVQLSVHNPDRARHRGGIWQLGDRGSIVFRELRWTLRQSDAATSDEAGAENLLSTEVEGTGMPIATGFELRQYSSGGDNWRSPVHLNAAGEVALEVRGFEVRSQDGEILDSGDRATPRLRRIQRGGSRIGLSMKQFWQNFPKSISVSDAEVALALYPGWHPELHELQGGEQKTDRWCVELGDLTSAEDRQLVSPAHLRANPAHYAACGVEPLLEPAERVDDESDVRVRQVALEGENGFFYKREAVDEYGWRNFGELWADHEALHDEGSEIFVSHYNNQYDGIYAFGLQYLRTGDQRWFVLMDDLARHVADIDLYRTDADKPAYNGGLFWHTAHYTKAGTSTHRTYPRGSGGGGPSSEHAYAKGLMLHYFLTGDSVSRQAALTLARWLVDAEDGATLPWSLLDSGPTGAISSTVEPDYHGPGRGPGNAIACLLVGYRLSPDPAFQSLAEELVERCIHPADDPASRGLDSDPERRWSYTVFLHALFDLLEWKRERQDFDRSYLYARSALLRYAEWMVEHEYFYLDQPDRLEYPNDTWAAQELRKSDVLALAALLVEPECRAPFIERATEFRQRSLDRLLQSPELSLTRLLVLSLRYGRAILALRKREDSRGDEHPSVPVEAVGLAPPVAVPFRARRARLMQRFPFIRLARAAVQAVRR